MGTFKFQCPVCSGMMDVPDEMMGQVEPCPNCHANITFPKNTSSPKQRIVISKKTANALADGSHIPAPHKSRTVGSFIAGLVIGVIIAAVYIKSGFIQSITSMFEGASRPSLPSTTSHPSQPANLLRLSKQQWINKLNMHYDVLNNSLFHIKKGDDQTVDNFIKLMGKPDRTQSIGKEKYLYYSCIDGYLQVMIELYMYDHNFMIGAQINEY